MNKTFDKFYQESVSYCCAHQFEAAENTCSLQDAILDKFAELLWSAAYQEGWDAGGEYAIMKERG